METWPIKSTNDHHIHESFRKVWSKEDVYSEELISFLESLDQFYPILSKICSYLPLRELESILKVFAKNAAWQSAASRELQSRTNIAWFATTDEDMIVSKSLFHSNLTNALIFFQDMTSPFRVADNNFAFLQKYCLFKEMNNIALGLRYVQLQFKSIDRFINSCTIYLPNIPNIDVMHFSYGPTKSDQVWETLLADNEQLECLMTFTLNENPTRIISTLHRQLQKIQSHKSLPIAGGCVYDMFKFEGPDNRCDSKESAMHCIAFKSNRLLPNNFYAASIVIQENEDCHERAQFFISKLKIKEEAILFLFACKPLSSRVADSDFFTKLIDCPIVAAYVEGEIGVNHFDESECSNTKKNKTNKTQYFHGFTFTLLYISWGQAKKM